MRLKVQGEWAFPLNMAESNPTYIVQIKVNKRNRNKPGDLFYGSFFIRLVFQKHDIWKFVTI